MSYAVLHIMKASGSCNAIARHIERSTQPDNAHAEMRHLNRDDFIKYPDGVSGLGEAIQHRLDHAGLTRKIGKNQVLALNILLSSDGEALRRLADEGRLNEWAESSVRWAKETFGEENVVGAHLHMDEQTPHLHVTVVPIVTTERKKKASEAKARKHYRTKSGNAPRLSADSIMTRENLSHFQDTYSEAMARFGLERGIRGSEARHVDQHEYYRQCQIAKVGLEKDVAELSTEKKRLDKEKRTLESKVEHLECSAIALDSRKKMLSQLNEEIQQQNRELYSENARLTEANSSLSASNTTLSNEKQQLESDHKKATEELADIEADKSKLIKERSTYVEEAEAAKKERETALMEAAAAKAQRDANRKDLIGNLANRFTGSKTKRLETELAEKEKEILELKKWSEARESDLHREISNLSANLCRQKEERDGIVRSYEWKMGNISKFFPQVIDLLPAIEECQNVKLSDKSIKTLLSLQECTLNPGAKLYFPFQERDVDASGANIHIKRAPDDNKFHLYINGTRVFQWLKEQWQRLKQTFSRGLRY